MQTVLEIVKKTTEFFRNRQIESARLDAELLIADALGWSRLDVFTKFDYPLSDSQLELCRSRVKRRATGEPVAYILGYKDFYQHRFKVSSDTLIPRPDSEILVDRAIESAMAHMNREGAAAVLRIADFGCGSGCLGISVALELSKRADQQRIIELTLFDVSEAALEIARENVRALVDQDASQIKVSFNLADLNHLSAGEVGEFDLILANPPYIEEGDTRVEHAVEKFEPRLALFSDEKGLGAHRRWRKLAAQVLRPGGLAFFEIGFDQGSTLLSEAQSDGFQSAQIEKDLAGHDRVLALRKGE